MATTDADAEDAYADGLPLVELFGDTARARICSVLATKRSREFTVTELAEAAGLTRKSVYEHLDDLAALDALERVDAGRSTRYRAADSEVVQKLYELDGLTLERLLDAESDAA